MLTRSKLLLSCAVALITASASADPLVYVVNLNQQFGTVNLSTGAFHQIGPNTPEDQANLVAGPNGTLLSLTSSGKLESINPATGVTTVVGDTGLGFSAFDLAEVNGNLYATDFSNNLYNVNAATGHATLLRATGIPPDPAVPFTTNPDGTLNLCDESLYGKDGKLYATFDAIKLGTDGITETPSVDPDLYQIDPNTGVATLIASTALGIGASVEVNGTFYAFQSGFDSSHPFPGGIQFAGTLDLTNGSTSFPTSVDSSPIFGAAPVPTPEPASLALIGTGLAALATRLRRRHS